MALLELRDVHTYYGNIHALKGISLTVEPGEIVTLIGANGAGKSTTLKTISGLLRPREGEIWFDGAAPRRDAPPTTSSRPGISQVPGGPPHLPADDRAREPRDGRVPAPTRARACTPTSIACTTLFPRLKERDIQNGGTLSGGEQQMLAIGRALMARPKLLLLDEPSMGLAPILVEQIFDIVKDINASGTTVLLVEQNALMALGIAKRGYILQTGEIVLEDSADRLTVNPEVQKAYLGG